MHNTSAQATSRIAVVQLFTDSGAKRVFVSYGDGRTEQQDLVGVIGKKDQEANTEQLQKLVARLYAEGYALIATFSTGTSETPASTLVFRKN